MRITFVVERPTQFEVPFFRHVARAARDGQELRVLFTGEGAGRPAFDPEIGREVSWGFDLLSGYPRSVAPQRGQIRWLAREISRELCDLVIVNGYTQRDYLLAALLARRAGVPTALRLDSALWDAAAGPGAGKPLLFALLLPLFDLFLGVGSLTLDYLAACGVPAERTGLFPYAVDVEHFRAASRLGPERRAAARERLGLPPGAKAVLAVAKLAPREAPWDLVRALPYLPGDVRLLLAGDGPARADLEHLAARLGADRVRFLGYVPYGELAALYATADLFVHPVGPDGEERWGVSVAEALACGLPVVASSRVGAGRDLVLPGENGAVYPAGDPKELARRIAEALALTPERVAAASRAVLSRWDYPATWRSLAAAAARASALTAGDLGW